MHRAINARIGANAMQPNASETQAVIGPIVTREGGYAFDLWTPEAGMIRGFCHRRVEDACYARKYEIKSRPGRFAASLTACATLDEFTAALSQSGCVAEGGI
jgi:hypothetical protein